MIPESFAVVGALIASIGGFVYLYDTIRGRAKPNRVTWLLWGILPMIGFVAQRVQGVEGVSWATFVAGFTPLLIFVASFLNRDAYWKTTPLDYACMVMALIGIALWSLMKDPNTAILFSLVADFAAGLPTIRKAYAHPQSESWRAYSVSTAGFTLSLLAVHVWTFENYSFVAYFALLNGVLAVLSFRGRSLVANPAEPSQVSRW
jgi:hypothetical protein